MTYIPEAYIITRSEADHIRNTLEDAQMFYEMYASKPGNINDDIMEFRLKDCDQAQHIRRNLESDETPKVNYYGQEIKMARAIDQVVDAEVWTDTDYFD